MRRTLSVLAVAGLSTCLLNAQFGLGKLKDKLDSATNKTKPATDRAQRAAGNYTAWTPEEEQAMGGATATKMIAMFGIVTEPKLVRYVNLVGQSVAQFAP